jgi:hypothetical protein
MMKGPGAGSVLVTNGSGCGSGRPMDPDPQHCKILMFLCTVFSSVPDPWHFGVDPDPRIHAFD